ncbi:MAG: hypothetical protein WCE81_03085 [Halobacteriota archaeon]
MSPNTNNTFETDDTKRDNDFKLISDELKRQFDLRMRFDDSHDAKFGIILGFIMVIIVQIALTTEYTNIVMANPIAFAFFLIGFAAIFCLFG